MCLSQKRQTDPRVAHGVNPAECRPGTKRKGPHSGAGSLKSPVECRALVGHRAKLSPSMKRGDTCGFRLRTWGLGRPRGTSGSNKSVQRAGHRVPETLLRCQRHASWATKPGLRESGSSLWTLPNRAGRSATSNAAEQEPSAFSGRVPGALQTHLVLSPKPDPFTRVAGAREARREVREAE